MERENNGGKVVVLVAAAVAAVVLANDINAERYTCWGGCYDQCILLSSNTTSDDQPPQDRFPCYYQCLNGCVPPSADDYRYYCQIGCNLQRCPPNTTYDGAQLEKCYAACIDLCKNI